MMMIMIYSTNLHFVTTHSSYMYIYSFITAQMDSSKPYLGTTETNDIEILCSWHPLIYVLHKAKIRSTQKLTFLNMCSSYNYVHTTQEVCKISKVYSNVINSSELANNIFCYYSVLFT